MNWLIFETHVLFSLFSCFFFFSYWLYMWECPNIKISQQITNFKINALVVHLGCNVSVYSIWTCIDSLIPCLLFHCRRRYCHHHCHHCVLQSSSKSAGIYIKFHRQCRLTIVKSLSYCDLRRKGLNVRKPNRCGPKTRTRTRSKI